MNQIASNLVTSTPLPNEGAREDGLKEIDDTASLSTPRIPDDVITQPWTPVSRAMLFIVVVAAAGFFFDSFDIVIVSYALPAIRGEIHLDP